MTVQMPKSTLGDWLLSCFGRQRAVRFPLNGLHGAVYVKAKRESFLRALLRKRNSMPPEGWFYPVSFTEKDICNAD